MKRRSFVIAAAFVGGFAGWRFMRGSDQDAIVTVIKNSLSYLKLDDAGVRQFAHDLAAIHLISNYRLRFVTAAGPLYPHLRSGIGSFSFDSIKHGEERIVSNYLLSSDFFVNGSDETRLVMYQGYYNPLHACSNPFARPVTA